MLKRELDSPTLRWNYRALKAYQLKTFLKLKLKRYGVHDHWISLVQNYYVGIYSKSFSESAPSNWHQHQRSIFAGCTLSIILFLAGMNIILGYVLVACAPHFVTSSKVSLPLVKAFMDDVNIDIVFCSWCSNTPCQMCHCSAVGRNGVPCR